MTVAPMNLLEKEFKYYLDNQAEFVKSYSGKFLAIKDQKIIGVYDARDEALKETSKTHELGTFLIQQCSSGDAAYSQTFHSRVIYN